MLLCSTRKNSALISHEIVEKTMKPSAIYFLDKKS